MMTRRVYLLIIDIMKLGYCLAFMAIVATLSRAQEEGEGERRLKKLKQMADSSKGIISFSS